MRRWQHTPSFQLSYHSNPMLLILSPCAPALHAARCCHTSSAARSARIVSCEAVGRDVAGSRGDAGQTPPFSSRSRQLANGQGFMLDEAAAAHDVVYGQNFGFVITRPRQNPRSLVRRPGAAF